MKNIIEIAQATVVAQIGGNRGHGWGKKDQEAVVAEATIADVENAVEAAFGPKATLESAKAALMKWTPSEELMQVIGSQLNGSAFRQSITQTKKEKRFLDEGDGQSRSTVRWVKFAE